jgi:hypothetical protein
LLTITIAFNRKFQEKPERNMDANLEQQVRMRAYELWVLNGKIDGHDSDYWYAAESEVLAKGVEASPIAIEVVATKTKAKRKAKTKA